MRFEGSNRTKASARPRRIGVWTCAVAFSICIAFGAPSAGAAGVSLDTPLVGVDVDVGEGGVNVGVDVPPVDTNVEANVGVGDDGVSVDADVNSPATNTGSDTPGSQTGSGGQQDGSGSSKVSGADPASNPKVGSAADAPRSEGRGGSRPSARRTAPSRGAARSTATRDAAATGGLVGLVAMSQKSVPAQTQSDTSGASVVAQLVEYIPTWLWVLLALLLAALVATAVFALHQYRRRRAADSVALQDPLTGVANVKAFDQRLAEEWARARRHGSNLGVLMIDLDRFKEINDSRGHATGDRVLIATATALRRHTRESDLVARVGGDEFAVICPETSLRGLKKLRGHLEQDLPLEIGFGIDLSIGVAAMRTTDDLPKEMVARADSKMYETKSSHRLERESGASLVHA